ncbi:MAG TPA: M48 family metalloprotease [Phycisphaerae bacterium]|nr:M48 family metalloprotease [Phycisphaerae bacterium]HUU22337.1 M48 family metalloprotease [Phycisphaerae bacterium]
MAGGTHVGALCVAGGIWLAAAGCVQNPATGERWPRLISTGEEITLGRQAAPQFESEFGGKLRDETVQQYVRQVGARLASGSERKDVPYEYALLASDEPNAFALPGGKIYLTAGLMTRMANERQLAAALGHETGHIAAGHNVQAIQRQMGTQIFADLAAAAMGSTAGEVTQVAGEMVGAMLGLRYSRQDEYQADQLGIRYMTKAGHNPYGIVELLEALQREEKDQPGKLAGMFLTHPLTSDRIEEARKEIRKKHPGASPDASDPRARPFQQMRARVARALETKR